MVAVPPTPNSPEAMNNKDRYWDCLSLAMEASNGGHTDEALAWLDEALKVRPGGAEAHNGRGEVLWDDNRAEDALRQFELAMEADPKFVVSWLNRAELLIEELGEFDHAIAQCDRLLAGEGDSPHLDHASEAEVYYLKAKALFYLENLEGALFLVRRAVRTLPEFGLYRGFEGQVLFELGHFEDARRQLEYAVRLDPDSGYVHYHLGLVAERLGDDEQARQAFRQANALDPDHYPLPVASNEADFEKVVEEAIANLPRSILEYVESVPVLVRDFPDADLLKNERVSPQLLGIFIGVPSTEQEPSQQVTDPNRIFLFRRNLEKVCRTHAELVEQIAITVKHEIGHYLGFDEEDMKRLGLA